MRPSRRLLSVPLPPLPTERDDHEQLQALAHEARASESAFDRLARAVRGLVLRWAHSATGDVDEAEDVAQLVLLRLRAKGDGFEGRGSLTGWLHRVTRNITLDRQRVARRRQILLQAAERDAEHAATPTHDPEHPPLVPIVRAFLHELTPRQQTVIELIDLRGAAYGDTDCDAYACASAAGSGARARRAAGCGAPAESSGGAVRGCGAGEASRRGDSIDRRR